MKLVTGSVLVTTEQMIDTGAACSGCHARFLLMHGFPVYCRRCYQKVSKEQLGVRCASKLREDDPVADMIVRLTRANTHQCIVEGCGASIRKEFALCVKDRGRVLPSMRKKVIALHRELNSYEEGVVRRYLELVEVVNRRLAASGERQ